MCKLLTVPGSANFFQKSLDKCAQICYNKDTEREAEIKMYLLNEDYYEVIVHSAMDSIFYVGYNFQMAMERYTKALTGFPCGYVEFYKNGEQIIKTKIFSKTY